MNKQLKQTVHSSALKGSVVLFLVVVAACFLEGTKINESFKSQAQADFNINLIGNGMNFNHFWKRSVGSCHATFCLRADWREQLKLAQKELGFTGIRFQYVSLCFSMILMCNCYTTIIGKCVAVFSMMI